MSTARRRAATEQHELAIAAINAMFDRAEDLTAARNRLAGIAPLGTDDDPIRDAEVLVASAEQVSVALDLLRVAAVDAAQHRSRNALADDLGTKATSLFPRVDRHPGAAPLTVSPQPQPARPVDEKRS